MSLVFRTLACCSGLLHSFGTTRSSDQFPTSATYRGWSCFPGPPSVGNADSQSGWAWVLFCQLAWVRETPGSAGIAPMDGMPALLCSIELARGFNTVHAGRSAHLSVPRVWSWGWFSPPGCWGCHCGQTGWPAHTPRARAVAPSRSLLDFPLLVLCSESADFSWDLYLCLLAV